MKLNEHLARTVSIGTVLALSFATLLFALLLHEMRTAPVHAQKSISVDSATSTPSSGPVSTVIQVTGLINEAPAHSPVLFGYATNGNCNQMNLVDSSSNPTLQANGGFEGWFSWPSGAQVNAPYFVCARAGNVTMQASGFMVLSASPPSISVDQTSYNVGDTMIIQGHEFYPDQTSVKLTLKSLNSSDSLVLNNSVTSDFQGFLNVNVKVTSDVTGTVEIVATVGSGTPPTLKATSDQFTIHNKTKASATPKPTPKPTPTHTAATPSAAGTATPTPAAGATATPTPVPTAVSTVAPGPTVAPTPTQAPVATTNTNNTFFSNLMSGKLPFVVGIGLGMVLSLGILTVGGWLLLHRPRKPTPLPYASPNSLPPWMRSPNPYMQRNPTMNGDPFGQPMDDQPPIVNGGYAPGPGYGPQQMPYNGIPGPGNAYPQQVPYNGPYASGNAQPQQVPYDDPFGSNGTQRQVPYHDPFGPDNAQPQQVPYNDPFGQGY